MPCSEITYNLSLVQRQLETNPTLTKGVAYPLWKLHLMVPASRVGVKRIEEVYAGGVSGFNGTKDQRFLMKHIRGTLTKISRVRDG